MRLLGHVLIFTDHILKINDHITSDKIRFVILVFLDTIVCFLCVSQRKKIELDFKMFQFERELFACGDHTFAGP